VTPQALQGVFAIKDVDAAVRFMGARIDDQISHASVRARTRLKMRPAPGRSRGAGSSVLVHPIIVRPAPQDPCDFHLNHQFLRPMYLISLCPRPDHSRATPRPEYRPRSFTRAEKSN
jgi:hypothetical protein